MEITPSSTDSTPARRLTRVREGRMVAGVAAGIAERFSLDVGMVRLAFVIAALFGGSGFLAYLAAWALIPEEGETVAPAERWFSKNR